VRTLAARRTVRLGVQQLKRRLLPPPGPQRIPFGIGAGITLNVDFQSDTRLYLGLYEIELNRHLRRLCTPGTLCFDVGGGVGYDALVLARLTGASVASFELDPRSRARMDANFALNPERSLISTVSAAVGTGPGQLALDDFGREAFRPGFIKIDVDGGELEVLRSAERLLVDHRPSLIVETHSAELEQLCGRFLHARGYRPVVVYQRLIWKERRPIEHNRWLVASGLSVAEGDHAGGVGERKLEGDATARAPGDLHGNRLAR
jgi:methyltransferase FkbM-like protein